MKPSIAMLTAALALLLVPGCGDDDESNTMTIDTPQGKAKVTTNQKGDSHVQVVDTPDGKAVISSDASGVKIASTDKSGNVQTMEMSGKADLAPFEGLLYSGAKLEDGSTVSFKSGESSTSSASFWSDDSPEKLVEHYKKAFPKAMSTEIGGLTTIAGKTAAGADFSISIMKGEDTDKTKLTMMVIKQG